MDQATMNQFMNNPAVLDVVQKRMLMTLSDTEEQFVFVYCMLLGYQHKDAADVLHVSAMTITRIVKRIRDQLQEFRLGYEDLLA